MRIDRFEDIEAWREARELLKMIFSVFKPNRDYDFKGQIQRASISVMSNIAEGFDRGTNKEFIQFLKIARGSLSEIKSLCYSALDLGYIADSDFNRIMDKCNKIACLINGFIRYLKNSKKK